MSSDQNAENRLIILYLLNKMDIEITDLHLTEIFRTHNLMNYFSMQEQLAELVENKFVNCTLNDNDRIVYTITQQGRDVLSPLTSLITPGIRFLIEDIASKTRNNIKNEYETDADFTPIDKNNYIVTCYNFENGTNTIKFDINVPTREDAIFVKNNWKKHSSEIYQDILNAIYKKRD